MVLDPKCVQLSIEQVHELIRQYLSRLDETLTRLQAEQRPDRPKSRRIDQIEVVRKSEQEEYEKAGFEIPDLTCVANLTALRVWDGTKESLNLIKIVRIKFSNKSAWLF